MIAISGVWDYRISSLGAQALSEGICTRVAQVFPGERQAPLGQRSLFPGCGTLVNMLGRLGARRSLVDALWAVYRRRFADRAAFIAGSRRLVVSGDGVVGDLYPYDTLLLALDIRAAQVAGVPFVSLNQSLNCTPGSLADYCVRRFFAAGPLAVREPLSLRYARESLGLPLATLAIDSAFLVPPIPPDEAAVLDRQLDAVLAGRVPAASGFVLVGIRGNRPRSQRISLSAWAKIVEHTAACFGRPVVLASTCPEYDLPLARRLQQEVPAAVVLPELIDWARHHYRFFLRLLARAHACVSDRYHQSVFAVLTGTPFLAVSGNTAKTEGLHELLGLAQPVQALPSPATLPDFCAALDRFARDRNEQAAWLRAEVPGRIRTHDRYAEILEPLR